MVSRTWFKIGSILATIALIAGAAFIALAPRVEISASNQILSISLENNIIDQSSVSASYVAPTVTKLADNSFDINFTGTKHKVHIGNGGANFIGRMILGAWDNECIIDLQMENITGNLGKATLVGTGETAVISVENNAWKLVYKPVPPKAGFNEYGGIDYIMTIKRKTSYNIINFTYNATNVVAYFQPPLTSEFAAGWNDEFQCNIEVTETDVTRVDNGEVLFHRPDYVVNSIAFYHATKGGMVTVVDANRGITTGKIGMLYAMKVTDSSAVPKTAWTKWTMNGNTITLTIPLTFLQTATFPVVIAPVGDFFGHSTTGSSAGNNTNLENVIAGIKATPSSSGTVTSMSMYANLSSGSEHHNVKTAIYDDSGSASPISNGTTTQVHETVEGFTWRNYTFAVNPTVVGSTTYKIVGWANSDIGTFYLGADTTNNHGYTKSSTYGASFPTAVGFTENDYAYLCIYCTYTPEASYDITETTTSKAMGILAINTTTWAIGHTPDNPIDDGHCTFTLTNNAAGACDIDMKMADFTGGVGWNIEETSNPAADEVQINAYISGSDPTGAGLLLKNADQEFKDNMAGSSHFHWDYAMLTGTSFSDGAAKSGVLTMTARAHS